MCFGAFFLLHRDAQRVAPAVADRDFISPCWCATHAMCLVCCEEKKGHRRCTPKSVSCKPLTPWFAKVKRNMLVLKKLNYALKETNLAFLVSGPLSQIPIWGSPFQAPISSHHLRSPTSDPPPQTSYLRPHASPLSRNPGLPSQVTYAWRLILCPSLETLSQRHNNR